MRTIPLAMTVSLLATAGCSAIVRNEEIQQCRDFYQYTRDEDVNPDVMRAVCECAVDRQASGATPRNVLPDGPEPELGEYRRHIPDCLEANDASPTGVAAQEGTGAAPSALIFDPATGQVTDSATGRPPPPRQMPEAVRPDEISRVLDEANKIQAEARQRTDEMVNRMER